MLRAEWPRARNVLVYCGAGNNAGDGYVLARLAHEQGVAVRVLAVAAPERLKGDARRAYEDCAAAGVAIEPFVRGGADSVAARSPEVIVDALLGIGADRPLDGDFAAAVAAINAAARPVLALDVPSGLHADTGWPLGCAVRAAVTVTFVGLKQGLYLGAACDYAGRIEFADLALPQELGPRRRAAARAARNRRDRARVAAPRAVCAQGHERPVAARRRRPVDAGRDSARSRSGAAYRRGPRVRRDACRQRRAPCSLGGPKSSRVPWAKRRKSTSSSRPRTPLCSARVSANRRGPAALWRRLLATDLPLIVDADGLNLLAEAPQARGRWILTPHPGEAARLLGASIEDVQRERARRRSHARGAVWRDRRY